MNMNSAYALHDTSNIFSPALLFYKDIIRRNIACAIEIAGNPAKLRPHVKTHKTREIVQMEKEAGITKHKCSTVAEAEMLAQCGIRDVFLAYNPVGPNCTRMAQLAAKYPECRFSVTADHPTAVAALSATMVKAGQRVDVLLDLNVGQNRTGIAPGAEAATLYQLIAKGSGLRPGGLHVYDGHNHQENLAERKSAVLALLEPVMELRHTLEGQGLPVPRVVCGGTPTFPVFANLDFPGLECSPGTFVLHDNGYGSKYADLSGFMPAALLLTRVMSRPTPNRVTFDLGYKAVASDPPAGKRLTLLDVNDYQAVLQNEEHLVIETPHADRFKPGDVAFAIPTHICPTCAMHQRAYVIEKGQVMGTWDIVARDRVLTV
jgi:D-serine deaminase-like pyridoxal phosphate-dependent protein